MKQPRKRLPRFGTAKLCEYIPGEDPKERHQRRYELALCGLEFVKSWCEHRSIQMKVREIQGRKAFKWYFRPTPDTKFLQWIPYIGKASFKYSYKEDRKLTCVKIHDVQQLIVLLEHWLARTNSNELEC